MKNNTDFLKIEQPADCTGFYELKTFDTLIVSFCADTPRGSTVEVEARICLMDGRLTEWFSWGVWSPLRGSPQHILEGTACGSGYGYAHPARRIAGLCRADSRYRK